MRSPGDWIRLEIRTEAHSPEISERGLFFGGNWIAQPVEDQGSFLLARAVMLEYRRDIASVSSAQI